MPETESGNAIRRGEWLLLSILDRRQYAGNRGYADEHGTKYSFDSLVPNSAKVTANDRVAIRDRDGIKAIAVISRIDSAPGTKDLLRCPVCQTARIKERVNKTPRFRCSEEHAFDNPVVETRPCTQYTAHFDEFRTLRAPIPPERFRQACRTFNGQLSIQPIALDDIVSDLLASLPAGAPAFFAPPHDLYSDSALEVQVLGYVPSLEDARQRVLRQVCERRGQRQFRDELFARYGGKCAVSGCTLADILEAAHIRPYRSPEDNHPGNGVLLRCDLHTLFDLDLVGFEPGTYRIYVHSAIEGHGYSAFAGEGAERRFGSAKQQGARAAVAVLPSAEWGTP